MDWWKSVCEKTDFIENLYFPKSEKRKQQWNMLINDVESRLSLTKGADILEVCCGTCAVGVGLATRGYNITGLDLSESMLEYAKRRAEENKVEVEFIKLNALDIVTLKKKFDAVLLIDMAFGLLGECREDDIKLIKGIKEILKEGGKLLVEISNLEAYKLKGEFNMNGSSFRYSYKFNSSNNTIETEAFVEGVDEIRKGVGRVYSMSEVSTLFKSAGFNRLSFKSMDGKEEINNQNPSYILLCE